MSANWKNVGLAFLDGFAPLDNLFQKAVRPGSEDDLIASNQAVRLTGESKDAVSVLGERETEAYTAMRRRMIGIISTLDARFFSRVDEPVSDARR